MAESQEKLLADLKGLADDFKEQVRQFSVKQLVGLHETHIQNAKKTKTSAENQKRKEELDKLHEEVKKLIAKHEDRIKSGKKIDDKEMEALKKMNARLKEETLKLKMENKAAPAAPGGGETKTDAPSPTSDTPTAAGGAGSAEAKKGNPALIVVIVLVLIVAAAGAFIALKPKPAPAPSIFGGKKEEPKGIFNSAPEPEESSVMMYVVILFTLAAVGGGAFVVLNKKKGDTAEEARNKEYGLKRDNEEQIKGSHRVTRKNYTEEGDDEGGDQ